MATPHPGGVMNEEHDLETLQAEGELDAHTVEALRLQIRRLAHQHGVELDELTVERQPDDRSA
jgi:hypothetical protein